ncbi:MAG: thiol:disulfide interchange protein DsbC [Patiriisocius sp.]|jgi:thiol:disulfide interchange protein DsbC
MQSHKLDGFSTVQNMKTFFKITLLAFLSASFSPLAFSQNVKKETAELEKVTQLIMDRLKAARPDIPVLAIEPAQIPGFYDVFLPAGQVLHFTPDGKHFYTGDLYGVTDQLVNLTEKSRSGDRKELIDGLDESQMVVFSPPKDRVKATVTVFTDIDCVFCRKLHNEVLELNRLGVAVRYLAYPRSGVGSPSYDKLVSVWCAENPKMALTRAKSGIDIAAATCVNPVAAQFELGGQMGINSTPSLVFDDGTLSRGFMPAAELAATLGVL